jgi:glycerol-3-phosphate dehydrogenase
MVKTPKKDIKARFVLNCAGVFADKIAALLGLHDFTIHPRKGEEYMLDKGLQGIVKRLIFPVPRGASKGILIIPTFDGTIMVGPTAEEVDDLTDVCTSEKGADEVFSFVSSICPSIHPRHTIAEFAGLRAASNTGDFVIGPTSVNGFINVAGIQSPGLTASPAIALHVLHILGQEGLELISKDSWNAHIAHPPRFAQLSTRERAELCKEDKDFGSVVCRCELVTEAEIQTAIDHGARTLDGVKFRTRAGMGRCQGGFCSCRIMEDLAKRQGKKFHEITKRGKGSWIVVPAGEVD